LIKDELVENLKIAIETEEIPQYKETLTRALLIFKQLDRDQISDACFEAVEYYVGVQVLGKPMAPDHLNRILNMAYEVAVLSQESYDLRVNRIPDPETIHPYLKMIAEMDS